MTALRAVGGGRIGDYRLTRKYHAGLKPATSGADAVRAGRKRQEDEFNE
jgi:hypothetical protein